MGLSVELKNESHVDEIAAVVREMQGMDRVRKEQRGTGSGRRRRTARSPAYYVRRFVICGRLVGECTAEATRRSVGENYGRILGND